MKYLPVMALILGLSMALGCDDLEKGFEKVDEGTPGICKALCEDWIKCEWTGIEGKHEDDARTDREDLCRVECAYYVHNGTYSVRLDANYQVESVAQEVSGSAFKKFITCLDDDDLLECNGGFYYPWAGSSGQCSDFNSCLDELGLSVGTLWDIDACYYDGTPEYVYSPFGYL